MKKILIPLVFLFSVTCLFAQPVNDDCGGITDLGVIPFCPDTVWYTNVDATESDIGNDNFPTGCDGGDMTFVGRDVWFQFTTNDTLLDITITVTGNADPSGSTPMMNPQIAIYRGECLFDELALLKCGKAEDGSNEISIDLLGLDPNTVYFMRINDYSSSATPNAGTFQLCIDEQDPEFTVCDDLSVSSVGVLYDCGGPDEDYDNNTDNSFTICPDLLNSTNDGCITFALEYFNLESGFGDADVITFYDGPDTNSPQISNIGGNNIFPDGGGGVCYVAQASSGCLTVQFTTNSSVTFEGFCGAWETSVMPCEPVQPIEVEANVTNEELEDFVTTPQSFATITNVDCAEGQYGTFTATDSDLGLERGIILTSGSIDNAVGPNTQNGISTTVGTPGDQDLDSLSFLNGNGSPSNDACIVELDVFVATNELTFEYIFGSEEYPQFVNTLFNDIFALMVSGPGIVGEPGIGNQVNVATVPATSTAVSINNVNHLLNWEYYRYNTGGQSVEYNGLTSDFLGVKKSLTASIPVIPCTTYHLKFAIADRGDSIWDSGVFIGELEGDVPDISVQSASGVDYLVEDCTGTQDVLIISLDNPQEDTLYYDVTISGSATLGVDYTLDIPPFVVIPAGETQLSFPLVPLTDGIDEGIETIVIQLTANFGCGNIALNAIEIEIHDFPLVEIFAGADTAFVCSGSCLQMEVTGGATYEWTSTFPDVFDDPNSATPIACPTESQWVYVTGSISNAVGCNDSDSIFLQFIDPQLSIQTSSDINICAGDSVILEAVNNVNNAGLVWTPDDFLSADDQAIVTATPPFDVTYTATVNLSGCSASDEITINVNAYDPPLLTTSDTTICQGSVLQLADSILFTSTNYQWSPTDYIITDTDIAGAVAIPQEDIVYTLISSSEDNFCADTFEVNVTVLPAEISIDNGDYHELCLGDSILITTTNSTNGVGIVWTPNSYLDTLEGGQVWAKPTETVHYFAILTVGPCTVIDSITIRVDSLPDMGIFAVPEKDIYCKGEIVNLISPPYDPLDYPDIMHLWDPTIGQNSDVENYNLNITATESFTFIRSTNNKACSQMDTFDIVVVDPSEVSISPLDTLVCTGEQVEVTASHPFVDEFTWSNSSNAESSCPEDEECPSTTITMNANSVTVVAQADVMGCPVMAAVNLHALFPPTYAFPVPPQICEGESILLNVGSPNITATYDWTNSNGITFSTDATPTVSPTEETTYFLTIDNMVCPAITDSVTIFVAGQSTLMVPDDQVICSDESVDLVAESNNLGDFSWSTGQSDQNTNLSNITYDAGSGSQTVTVTFDNDCPDTPISDSFNVQVVNGIPVSLLVTPADSTYGSNPVTYVYNEGEAIQVMHTGTPGVAYEWVFNGAVVSTSETYNFLALNSGNLYFGLTSADGCITSGHIVIEVIPAIWTIPNAFTPDGDGINDLFRPLIKGAIEITKFKIFNRWGNLVYEYKEGDNGWDGTHKGKPAPTDVYLYELELLRPDGVTVEKQAGDITLIR